MPEINGTKKLQMYLGGAGAAATILTTSLFSTIVDTVSDHPQMFGFEGQQTTKDVSLERYAQLERECDIQIAGISPTHTNYEDMVVSYTPKKSENIMVSHSAIDTTIDTAPHEVQSSPHVASNISTNISHPVKIASSKKLAKVNIYSGIKTSEYDKIMNEAQDFTQAGKTMHLPNGTAYTIEQGDTLVEIARANNVSIKNILSFNKSYNANDTLIASKSNSIEKVKPITSAVDSHISSNTTGDLQNDIPNQLNNSISSVNNVYASSATMVATSTVAYVGYEAIKHHNHHHHH